jgi:hypothetical protein
MKGKKRKGEKRRAKNKKEKKKEKKKWKKEKKGNLDILQLNPISEAVLPNVFQMAPAPSEKPLHRRSQSWSRFRRSCSV